MTITRRFSTITSKFKGIISVLCYPQLSPTATSGYISKWHVKQGEQIKAYSLICDISTENLTQVKIDPTDSCSITSDTLEIELQEDLYLALVYYSDNNSVPIYVDKPIAILCEEEEDILKCKNIKASEIEQYKFNRTLWQAYVKKKPDTGGGCCS